MKGLAWLALAWLLLGSRRAPARAFRWPVPTGAAGRPVVSQEWAPPRHMGLDILFRRGGEFWAPAGTPIVAAADGTVARVVQGKRGHGVVVDHGGGVSTFYQHLESVGVAEGDRVAAGDPLGVMGIDPMDAQHVRHLHFELWLNGRAVDPGPTSGWTY